MSKYDILPVKARELVYKDEVEEKMKQYGFKAPDMNVDEFIKDELKAVDKENNIEEMLVYENCPHCNNEVAVLWNVENEGHSLHCPYCGERIMLCSECPVREGKAVCDWSNPEYKEEAICHWDDKFNRKSQSFTYKGYTLIQELKENYHYCIFDENDRFCMHSQCMKKIESQEEAAQHIENYLRIVNMSEEQIRYRQFKSTMIIARAKMRAKLKENESIHLNENEKSTKECDDK